jgi:hypothetical protein
MDAGLLSILNIQFLINNRGAIPGTILREVKHDGKH